MICHGSFNLQRSHELNTNTLLSDYHKFREDLPAPGRGPRGPKYWTIILGGVHCLWYCSVSFNTILWCFIPHRYCTVLAWASLDPDVSWFSQKRFRFLQKNRHCNHQYEWFSADQSIKVKDLKPPFGRITRGYSSVSDITPCLDITRKMGIVSVYMHWL